MIQFTAYDSPNPSPLQELFTCVFTDSEGPAEGALIGNLARELLAKTAARDLYCFVAVDGEVIVGGIIFSRLTFEEDIPVFILAPVAVHSDYQGKGIGQQLINHGLKALKEDGVSVVVTYGDPAFYAKVGFQALSPRVIRPPLKLSQPHGWLGQSLTGNPIAPIPGTCSCVQALDNPAYW
jgi:predicted N-acetyltransferase YhbS